MLPAGPGATMRGSQRPAWERPRKRGNGVTSHSRFTPDEARAAGEPLGIDWDASPFDLEQFRKGMDIELEHGTRDPETNVTDDDVTMTAKIARAHLNEFPDYYTRTPALPRWKPRRRRRRTTRRRVTEPHRRSWPSSAPGDRRRGESGICGRSGFWPAGPQTVMSGGRGAWSPNVAAPPVRGERIAVLYAQRLLAGEARTWAPGSCRDARSTGDREWDLGPGQESRPALAW